MTDKVKYRKLLDKLKAFLDSDYRAQCQMREDIKEVLHKLKRRQRKLQKLLEEEYDQATRDHLNEDIDLVRAQRKKGLEVLKKMEREPL